MEHTKPTRTRRKRMESISFDINVNNRTYNVVATPFNIASGEQLYRISYNNEPVHVFGWDEGLNRFAENDTTAEVIPPIVEMAIAEKLNVVASQMQDAA
ncbi:MAG: hypothetical protein QM726_01195 [Chitinophagaceae bacterium]